MLFYINLLTQLPKFFFLQHNIISTVVFCYHNLFTQLPKFSFLQHNISTVVLFYHNLLTQLPKFSFLQHNITSTVVLAYHNLLTQLPKFSFLQHNITSKVVLTYHNLLIQLPKLSFLQVCCATITCFHNCIQFIQAYLQKNENKLARPLHYTFPYEDDVLPLHNSKLGDLFYHVYPIYFKVCLIRRLTPRLCQLATVIYM